MPRDAFSGPERKLLLAFDVGTAYSGISYSILDPGKVPEIQGVHKFPGQGTADGNAKIPSILYYGKDGGVRAAGAETERDGMDIIAEEENWVKAEWFKLHLRPSTEVFAADAVHIPHLPLDKTPVDVFSDYLKYLNDYAKQYIQETHPGIDTCIWNVSEIHYIISYPNGWQEPQQAMIEQASEKAGLVTPNCRNVVTLLAEGEASLHTCIDKGLISEPILVSEGVTIVNVGEGTVDLSAYATKPDGKSFQEIAEAQCHFKGSIFVTKAASEYLDIFLKGSRYHQDIAEMTRYFDRTTKCSFSEPSNPCFIRFGSVRDKDPKLKITAGKLRLEGTVVASFFEPSIKCIVDAVLAQCRDASKKISNVFLVGSFSTNSFLFKRVKESLEPHGLSVSRPDVQLNNVVTDGSIAFFLYQLAYSGVTHHPLIPEDQTSRQDLGEHTEHRWKVTEKRSGDLGLDPFMSQFIQDKPQDLSKRSLEESPRYSSVPSSSDQVATETVFPERNNRPKSMQDIIREERKQRLFEEQRRLIENISRQTNRINHQNVKLDALQKKDSSEKWEDDLFETMRRGLNITRSVFHTRSSVSGECIRDQMKELNSKIACIAEMAVETSIGKPKDQGGLELVSHFLGKPFVAIFQDGTHLADKKFTRAILQIFLARSCMVLIDSWCLGKPGLDSRLDTIYNRIRSKEEQTVAGKWRQIVFEQLPHGPEADILPRYADLITQRLMQLSSLAGWGGDTNQIGGNVQKMMELVETIRMNVKAGIISADLQPWIAAYGDRYNPSFMKDAGGHFGGDGDRTPERPRVLGSTEVGLKVQWRADEGDDESEFRGLQSRTRVLLIGAFKGLRL
ncbi:Heat shock 70 kDa protein 12B [Leucoagaricus sp. SymC.cos]|nr:Heat shock 70 kDa protein 12B [Leucoagaricus sp. SymC.cos]